jgi:hypothetical protein
LLAQSALYIGDIDHLQFIPSSSHLRDLNTELQYTWVLANACCNQIAHIQS